MTNIENKEVWIQLLKKISDLNLKVTNFVDRKKLDDHCLKVLEVD